MAGLLLKGGELIDPHAGLRGRYDLRLRDGRVAEVGPDLAADGDRLLDVGGRLVVPGLIDQHAHCFVGASDLGSRTDAVCASTGVTTFVDGGSAGAATFAGMREFVMARSRVRILAFLNISAIGLAYLGVGELNHLPYADPDAAAGVAREHRDLILGIKVRNQKEVVGEAELEPLRRAIRAAELSGGLRVMIHVTNPPTPLDPILELLRPGDLVSHFLHGRGYGILDETGRIKAAVRAARQRGILFDVAHGRNHVNFRVAKAAMEQGFFPDTISSDLTSAGARGVVKDLPTTLSKFLNLGMPLEEVIRAATAAPARVIGRERELGTLTPGAVADVAALELEEGQFEFHDADGNTLRGRQRLSAFLTVKDAEIWWRR
ncbi:MAG: amidohydrolase/deacetylase family metallohydrolase [Candidatus Rokubacteria bacterium]|nr:amidohydrolase/deacetylase family metallohydrolase [Candidatus Rokubacteria bacterium]